MSIVELEEESLSQSTQGDDKEISKTDEALEIFFKVDFLLEKDDKIKFLARDFYNNTIFSSRNENLKEITERLLCIRNVPYSYIHHLIIYLDISHKSFRFNVPLRFKFNAKENKTCIYIDIKLRSLINLEFYVDGKVVQELEAKVKTLNIRQVEYFEIPRYNLKAKTEWIEYKDGFYDWYPRYDYNYYYYEEPYYRSTCCNII